MIPRTDDEREIERLLVDYATAVDQRDWGLLRRCFTPDVEADYEGIGTWSDVGALVTFMVEAHLGIGRSNHMLTNLVVDVDGDRATARCSVHAVLALANDPAMWFDSVGRYDDTLVRTPDGWRIAARRYTTTRMTSGRG